VENDESTRKFAMLKAFGVTPEQKVFSDFLKSVKRILKQNGKAYTCFISYAWYPDEAANKVLQQRLEQLQENLKQIGATVFLDIKNLRGDISNYMETQGRLRASHLYP